MSNLKSIVPPLELCKRIPAGEFEDSAMVWDIHGKFDKWHVEKRVKRSVRFGDYGIMSPPARGYSSSDAGGDTVCDKSDKGVGYCNYHQAYWS